MTNLDLESSDRYIVARGMPMARYEAFGTAGNAFGRSILRRWSSVMTAVN